MLTMLAVAGPHWCFLYHAREDVGQIDLSEQWRPFQTLTGGQPSGTPLTKLAKLRLSIAKHLPGAPQVQ